MAAARSKARASASSSAAADTARGLAASGVEAVALAIVINSGVTLVKTIPLRRFEDAAMFGIGLSPVFTVFQVDDQITSSPHIGGPTGDTRLMPDPAQTASSPTIKVPTRYAAAVAGCPAATACWTSTV